MTEPIVICPKCKAEIKLNESLTAPITESVTGPSQGNERAFSA